MIPEIEMPGHGLAALTAYPWLGCTGGPYAVWTHWGISDDAFTARARETTFEFIEKVLTEVLALFPSKLIHIGGTSVPRTLEACPLPAAHPRGGAQGRIPVASYFIHRIERWMHTHGREIIGLGRNPPGRHFETANIMSWNGSDPGIKAAQRGNPVIMTPKWYCYFDYSQTSDPGVTNRWATPATSRCGRLPPRPLRPAHAARPETDQGRAVQPLDGVHRGHPPRTAHGPTAQRLAEAGWANDRKDYNDFVRRIPALVAVYKAEGYNYAPYLFEGHRMTRRQRFRKPNTPQVL